MNPLLKVKLDYDGAQRVYYYHDQRLLMSLDLGHRSKLTNWFGATSALHRARLIKVKVFSIPTVNTLTAW